MRILVPALATLTVVSLASCRTGAHGARRGSLSAPPSAAVSVPAQPAPRAGAPVVRPAPPVVEVVVPRPDRTAPPSVGVVGEPAPPMPAAEAGSTPGERGPLPVVPTAHATERAPVTVSGPDGGAGSPVPAPVAPNPEPPAAPAAAPPEPAKVEPPKVDEPKPEAPKAEEPKVAEPTSDEPKPELAKADASPLVCPAPPPAPAPVDKPAVTGPPAPKDAPPAAPAGPEPAGIAPPPDDVPTGIAPPPDAPPVASPPPVPPAPPAPIARVEPRPEAATPASPTPSPAPAPKEEPGSPDGDAPAPAPSTPAPVPAAVAPPTPPAPSAPPAPPAPPVPAALPPVPVDPAPTAPAPAPLVPERPAPRGEIVPAPTAAPAPKPEETTGPVDGRGVDRRDPGFVFSGTESREKRVAAHVAALKREDDTSPCWPKDLVKSVPAAKALAKGDRPLVLIFYDDTARASRLSAAELWPVVLEIEDRVDLCVVDLTPGTSRPTDEEKLLVRHYYLGYVPTTVVLTSERATRLMKSERVSPTLLKAAALEAK